jgi:hypothetical protein
MIVLVPPSALLIGVFACVCMCVFSCVALSGAIYYPKDVSVDSTNFVKVCTVCLLFSCACGTG